MKYPILSSFITIFGILLVTGCNTTQPLHIAALDGDLAMVRDLSSKGNSINQKYTVDPTYQGFTPLHMAINNGHKDVALYLIKHGAYVNTAGNKGRTPLHLASYNGMPQVAKAIIAKGGNVNASTNDGATPLHSAAIGIKNNTHLLKILLTKGANINAGKDSVIGTPLLYSARYGDVDIANILVNNGADISATDESGNTTLHIASQFGRFELVNYLLMRNPDVNALNKANNTPLHLAVMSGRRMVAEQLVYHGANLTGKNSTGDTPLKCAEKYDKDTIIALLEPITETETKGSETETEKDEPSILAD